MSFHPITFWRWNLTGGIFLQKQETLEENSSLKMCFLHGHHELHHAFFFFFFLTGTQVKNVSILIWCAIGVGIIQTKIIVNYDIVEKAGSRKHGVLRLGSTSGIRISMQCFCCVVIGIMFWNLHFYIWLVLQLIPSCLKLFGENLNICLVFIRLISKCCYLFYFEFTFGLHFIYSVLTFC